MKKLISEENELDLYVLIKNGVFFLLKFKWILLLALLIGVLIGWFRVKQQPEVYTDYYQTEFYVKSSVITDEMLHIFIENCNEQLASLSQNNLKEVLKEIDPVKELSINGERTDIKVYANYREPVPNEDIFTFLGGYLKGLTFYQVRVDSNVLYIKEMQQLIQQKFDSVGVNLKGDEVKTQLVNLTKDNATSFLAYVNLLEKYHDYEKQLVSMNNSLEFVPKEPSNKLIDSSRKIFLTLSGYGMLLFIVTFIILYGLTWIKNATKHNQ